MPRTAAGMAAGAHYRSTLRCLAVSHSMMLTIFPFNPKFFGASKYGFLLLSPSPPSLPRLSLFIWPTLAYFVERRRKTNAIVAFLLEDGLGWLEG
jgi:hypothetical protein